MQNLNINLINNFSEFTENTYQNLLMMAKNNYEFCSFMAPTDNKHILLRHDIDFSMHRALKLAQLEFNIGVKSTYFLYPHSLFYNLFSPQISKLVVSISELGHEFGLHFDPLFYGKFNNKDEFYMSIRNETEMIEKILNLKLVAISFHNYGILENNEFFHEDKICGMINAYSDIIRKKYAYISDSNGIWRFKNLKDVLQEKSEDYLQVLTHPEWWTPEPMSPRARIQRCIDGYSTAVAYEYDKILKDANRPNIGLKT